MAGQDFSPQTEGSSEHGAARNPCSPKMRRFAGTYFLPFFLACLIRVTLTCCVFGTPATPAGTK
jgi:hypothetical protein